MMRLWRILIIIAIFAGGNPLWGHVEDGEVTGKTLRAIRIHSTPPEIDGHLDDLTWQQAPVFTGFTQRRPDTGQAATESTTVQFAYDDKALYVGVMAFDRQPEYIVARLARRDQWPEADFVQIAIDAHHDHQTNFVFQVHAGGSLTDGYNYDDGGGWDGAWDGVWQARQSRHENGWCVEYKIPYQTLRFSPQEKYTWGVNVIRYISRKKEDVYWRMVPLEQSGWPSHFGHLEGIEQIIPPKPLEIMPYIVGRSTFISDNVSDSRDFFSNLGVNMRYGLTLSLSLNATVNPDFGQVEADPAVLNLSVFETFFEERCPFFVDGADNFRTPIQLFYSRRIGKQPGFNSIPSGFQMVDRPDFTTILGAAKIMGKTTGKTSFGLMEALTAREYASLESVEREKNPRDFLLEPRSHILVGRVQQDLFQGNSHIGLTGTSLNRHKAADAYSGSVDWWLHSGQNAYDFWGQIASSQAGSAAERKRGWGNEMAVGKRSGWLQGGFHWKAYSKDFEINDLGFLWRNNYYETRFRLQLRKDRPWNFFRRNRLNINQWRRWNFDDVVLANGIDLSTWHQFSNYWDISGAINHDFRTQDDLDTRGGPLIVRPASTAFNLLIESDDRRAISSQLGFSWGNDTEGSTWRTIALRVGIKPAHYIEYHFQPRYQWGFDDAQWVRNIDMDGDGIVEHFVYGALNSKTLDLTTRLNVIFSRDLSLEFYLQPFLAVGTYKHFKELARPSSYMFTPYTELDYNPDFRRRSLQSNMVLRWEYRPGSTLFLVWSQANSAFSSDPSFLPLKNIGESFLDAGSDIFFIKVNYWLSL